MMPIEQIAELAHRLDYVLAERDRARATAVRLEQQIAAALALHQSDKVRGSAEHWCMTCGVYAPCETARVLGVEP